MNEAHGLYESVENLRQAGKPDQRDSPTHGIRRSRPWARSRSRTSRAKANSGPWGIVFIITRQDPAANEALLQLVDPLEDRGQGVGVAGDEGAAAGELGHLLQEGEIRSGDFGHGRLLRLGIDAVNDSAGPADRNGVQRHAQFAGQHGGLLGVERPWNGRLVVAIGQEHQDFLLGGGVEQGIEPPGDRVADIGPVIPRPAQARVRSRPRPERRGRVLVGRSSRDSWRRQPHRSGRPGGPRRTA